MKVAFVLPPFSRFPIGGYQMVYRYANALVEKGWQVDLYYLAERFMTSSRIFGDFKMVTKKVIEKINSNRNKLTWFSLNPKVSVYYHQIGRITSQYDALIATAVQTARFVLDQGHSQGEKYYFIQAFEDWTSGGTAQVLESYHLPLHKIVVAKWLEKVVFKETGVHSDIIPNFVDTSQFYPSQAVEGRENSVALLYHVLPEKNSEFGIRVLKNVQKKIPDLKVRMFGVPDKPENLPEYFQYFQAASVSQLRDEIYGQSKIYLLPPEKEGWGLTGMEAMACGAALVASNVGGIKEYTINKKDAVLLTPNDEEAFVNTIIKLLTNDDMCVNIASEGLRDIETFSLESSTNAWISLLEKGRL